MIRSARGHYFTTTTAGESVRAFVPYALPPNPPLEITGQRQLLLERATLAVGRLDSISTLLPNQISTFKLLPSSFASPITSYPPRATAAEPLSSFVLGATSAQQLLAVLQ